MMRHPMDLADHRILVTGASSGIGRATCHVLARLGARLVLVSRNRDAMQETCAALDGGPHCVAPFDLAESEKIPLWLKERVRDGDPLSGLVHSAGVQFTLPLRMLDPAKFEGLMRVNLAAAIQLTRGFRQKQVSTKPASVVFISSVMASVGQPGISAYCASKGALEAAVKSLALELASESIRVNCVAPGHVETPMAERLRATLTDEQFAAVERMHPLGLGRPEDVANAVAFLLAESGRWITGTTLTVDGGYTAH
jgi:NAD(P)-dependent dehydrogenase (short-subunit alcohol dehydrogenase family)